MRVYVLLLLLRMLVVALPQPTALALDRRDNLRSIRYSRRRVGFLFIFHFLHIHRPGSFP